MYLFISCFESVVNFSVVVVALVHSMLHEHLGL